MTRSFSTRAIHEGEGGDKTTGAHNTPIYQTATFAFERAEDFAAAIELAVDPDRMNPLDNFFYSRTSNPTNAALEKKLASLESAEGALVTSSGMAAVAISIMISAKSGDHVIVTDDLFVISKQFFERDCPAMGIEVSMFDVRDINQARAAIKTNTTAIFIETVTNPNIYIADLAAYKEISDEHGLTLIVDNTFLSPYLCRPIEQGADIVLHSATKYISGHGDTIAGVLSGTRDTIDRARIKMDAFGQCLSPLAAWLIMRGVRTLSLRMRQHAENGQALAEYLAMHPKVEWVKYPGLSSHSQHELAKTSLPNGYGGILSFRIKGGLDEMNRFANSHKLFAKGVSLGDVCTLIYPQKWRDNLIRVSVGCEDISDIIEEFEAALLNL
jgi:methionine-gamma-lyase|tara:strand:- start:4246 stop:5397 length:1152 start_codon:yes stop_codon:yes gene_type:complete